MSVDEIAGQYEIAREQIEVVLQFVAQSLRPHVAEREAVDQRAYSF